MSLPKVWSENLENHTVSRLKLEAARRFRILSLPESLNEWLDLRPRLVARIEKSLSVLLKQNTPPAWEETGRIPMDGYSISKICYQSRPGIKVTGNLYIPEGQGPFPGVIGMHGHWQQGRLAERVQARGHLLAKNGYVCLAVDAFGSGERSTEHGKFEYHGAMLGASLMNIGETLMGAQVADNMRGVDLLCSLPYVDAGKIGATGASGGGNQTMWLAALDERIQAVMPVVSVGSFESYVGGVNCICELLPDGLSFCEESGVLALIAPRALKICNCLRDCNPTFYASEMLRSFKEARKVFQAYGADEKLSYQLFDMEHGYWPEIREAMLGFFDLQLKGAGHGAPRKESAFTTLPEEDLMVFPRGKRPDEVGSIAAHCRKRGAELRQNLMAKKSINVKDAAEGLRKILRVNPPLKIKKIHHHSSREEWGRFSIEGTDGRFIPVLLQRPKNANSNYLILSSPGGKEEIEGSRIFREAQAAGNGLILFDLLGAGESGTDGRKGESLPPYHTLARSELWLGRTLMGEWVLDYLLMADFAKREAGAASITFGGLRDAALAALFSAALDNSLKYSLKLENAPVTLLFNEDVPPKFLTMAANIPGFLVWGDISLVCALTGESCEFINPLHSDGKALSDGELAKTRNEFATMNSVCGTKSSASFIR
ncbi:MAG: hypothetical protein A2X49_05025 [Lentisphaerae bacterium GWF2_52_8]|nr:MAG: hypothetical protein A2X49_05025 [Lentisphaerae bacterium GWF2_52_8]